MPTNLCSFLLMISILITLIVRFFTKLTFLIIALAFKLFSGIIAISYTKKRGLRIWILVRLCSLTLLSLFWCSYSLFYLH